MPSATVPAGSASNEEPAAAPPHRIPQLTYRNRSAPSPAARPSPMPGRNAAPDWRAAASQDADDAITVVPTTKSVPMRTARRQVDWALEPATPAIASTPIKAAPDPQTKHKSRKKGSSFFSFLAVKEPTSGALEQYAELQRKQATAKGTSFMAGVSSQKLPLEVPRVNTKWDGLPQMAAKPDLKRASTFSAGTLYGARRSSVATTNSSSKMSRRSQRSAESSLADLGRAAAPPPSLENLSIKSHPRHDSGTGVYEPLNPPSTGDSSKRMSGPPVVSTDAVRAASNDTQARAVTTTSIVPEPRDPMIRRVKATSTTHRHSCHLPSSTPKEIAPWAEPAESPSDPWPSHFHLPHHHHPRSCGIEDVDFITSSPISGAPEKSIEEQIADAERRTASVAKAARHRGRMPPSSNAEALARLDSSPRPGGDAEAAKPSSAKQKKGGSAASRFMRFAGKG
ncbi:ca2+-modulated nonselective cation channel polycystin [Diplodia corticola]|uniref:Ca2+-modulated nonselective cation channel polycystin n=1 Tax=Diplodia corticola TaxID=236234 RepID=A0A1J9QZM3_9PEZI|nr:ca2+-modulated nonselective cation channel polycystin [Diplodia corticola]OJD33840.1 ca2+-modulated nonselective cation channel polycystin [Diplodia corticola]